jgi:hypothetical protein
LPPMKRRVSILLGSQAECAGLSVSRREGMASVYELRGVWRSQKHAVVSAWVSPPASAEFREGHLCRLHHNLARWAFRPSIAPVVHCRGHARSLEALSSSASGCLARSGSISAHRKANSDGRRRHRLVEVCRYTSDSLALTALR